MLAGSHFHWFLTACYLAILRRHHRMTIVSRELFRDLCLTGLTAAAGVAAALLGGAAAFALSLLPRYRTLPGGLRTFFSRPS